MSPHLAAPTMKSGASRIPGYLRPRPARVVGLSPPVWAALLSVVGLLILEGVTRLGVVSPVDLVPPTDMASGALDLLRDRSFVLDQLLPSVLLIAVTFVIAAVLGVALAYLMWRSAWWRRALQPYLSVYYAVPTFAIYPIMVVLFGLGSVPLVLVAVAFSMVVITTNSLTGFDGVPLTVHKLALARRLTHRQYLSKVLLPTAVPDIAGGLRLGMVYATISVLAQEFIISTRGLGHFISNAYQTFQVPQMYAGILLICVVALVLNVTVAAVLNRLDWRRR